MTTRHTLAAPAPAPAPVPAPEPQSSDPSQLEPEQQKAAIPPPSPASAPLASNAPPPVQDAPGKTNDPPPPTQPAPNPTVAAASFPPPPSFGPSSVASSHPSFLTTSPGVPGSPPTSTIGPLLPPPTLTTTTSSSVHKPSSTNHHPSLTNHNSDKPHPSGTPYGVINGGNESNNRIMLTVSLVVVFAILAGMGLVVYCLFRRRTAKGRMHGFGGLGGGKNTSGSLGSSVAAGGAGSGIGSNRKSMTGRRQSSISLGGGGSVIDTGKGGDPMATALAEMQEQQPRISDVDMSRALQQNALLSRRSSTLSLGGLHHHNHHQYLQQNQHPGGHVVSPTLGPARPQSAMTAGYWGGGGPGPTGDPTGEGSRRASTSGESIVIGSGNYVAGPLESSPDFRTTLYDELYYPSRQFLYPSGGGSSGANSNEQLLPPHHHQNSNYYNSGPPSSANMSRRSSLLPAGAYATQQPPEMSVTDGNGQNPSPIFRIKTISTSSGHNYQQQMQYQQHYPPQAGSSVGPHEPTPAPLPPHLNRMSSPQPPAASSETTSKYPPSQQHPEGAGVGVGDTIPRTSSPLADLSLEHHQRHPRRPQSTSILRNNPSFASPYGTNIGPDRSRSPPPLMSSSTGYLLDQQHQPQHRASYDESSQLVIPPSITTRRRSIMPGGHPGGATSPGSGGYVYQQGRHPQQHPYGGQDYFQDGHHQHPISPRSSVSPYGHGGAPYQYSQMQQQQQYAAGRSSTQLTREHDHHGKSELIQDEGAGVGVGSSIMTYSSFSSSSSSSGGASSTSTIPTPIQTAINLNSARSKSPPLPPNGVRGGKSGRSNLGNGPKFHIAPAPSSSTSSSSSRTSASAAAAGLTISTPVDRGPLSAADLQLTEVLNSPTDSSAH